MDNNFYNILGIFKRLNESALNELDTLAPRTVYFKMPDGNYLKADYRGTQGIFGGGQASADGVSFTSMSWVTPQTAKTLGLEKFLAVQGNMAGSIAQKGGHDVAIVGQRSMDVVEFTKGNDSVPNALKTKVVQWVEKNPPPTGTTAPAASVPPSQQVAQNQQFAETCDTGTTFVGKMAGTDPAGARYSKLVGECDAPVTLADKLRARWEETKRTKGLTEYGMTTGGTAQPSAGAAGNPVDAAKTAQQINNTQQNLGKLKSAGVELPQGVSTAAKATVATTNNPDANQTGNGMDQTAKKTAMGLGQEMENLLANGDPSQIQQLANAIKKSKMST
jgi:hypothetical protein